jgi:hypothetical protein
MRKDAAKQSAEVFALPLLADPHSLANKHGWLKPGAWGKAIRKTQRSKAPRFSPYRLGQRGPTRDDQLAITPWDTVPASNAEATAFCGRCERVAPFETSSLTTRVASAGIRRRPLQSTTLRRLTGLCRTS